MLLQSVPEFIDLPDSGLWGSAGDSQTASICIRPYEVEINAVIT